jgi:hypothetical protein
VNVAPSGIGTDGVITSLSAGHCDPFCELPLVCGEHAGGFGFVALTAFRVLGRRDEPEARGLPVHLDESTDMFGPEAFTFVRSKSRLKSVRHGGSSSRRRS